MSTVAISPGSGRSCCCMTLVMGRWPNKTCMKVWGVNARASGTASDVSSKLRFVPEIRNVKASFPIVKKDFSRPVGQRTLPAGLPFRQHGSCQRRQAYEASHPARVSMTKGLLVHCPAKGRIIPAGDIDNLQVLSHPTRHRRGGWHTIHVSLWDLLTFRQLYMILKQGYPIACHHDMRYAPAPVDSQAAL